MPPLVRQAISATLLSTLITSITVAIFLGFGSMFISKSEEVTRIIGAIEAGQKNFESIAADIESVEASVKEISISTMANHLAVLNAVHQNEQKDEVFRSAATLRLDSLERDFYSTR